jgi:hypothetical protein
LVRSGNLPDWYLARNGYGSQQTDIPEDPARPDNLWEPVRGDYDAHGEFDHRARSDSYKFWMMMQRHWLALALACAAELKIRRPPWRK